MLRTTLSKTNTMFSASSSSSSSLTSSSTNAARALSGMSASSTAAAATGGFGISGGGGNASSSSARNLRGVISSSRANRSASSIQNNNNNNRSMRSSSIVRFSTNGTSIQSISLDRRVLAMSACKNKRSNSFRLLSSAAGSDDGSAAADVEGEGKKEDSANKEKKSNYPKLHVKTSGRVVAIGDLHGDIQQARRALRIAGVLGKDDDDHVNPQWVGGDTVLVQVGDVLDRGDDEIGILILLQKLGKAARKAGGDVFVLNGNHEVLNISGDFRYVSRGAFHESMRFSDHLVKLFGKDAVPGRRRRRASKEEDTEEEGEEEEEDEMDEWRKQTNARVGLFSPGGPLAQQLSMHNTVLIVNDTVFAHGGLVPRHVDFGLDKLNKSVSEWMRGKRIEDEETKVALGMAIGGVKDSVVWHRAYGTEHYATNTERTNACTLLSRTLDKINEIEGIPVKRLVVGHTPQMQGANCECDGKIWRVDVGMSFGVLGANPQVLEIIGDEVKILTREAPVTMSKL